MKTIRTILSVLLCAVLTLGVFPVLAPAESDVLLSGECGETGANLTWTLRANGYLTVSGEGAMADFTGCTAPWTAALRDGTLAAKLSQTAQTPQEAQSDWDAMVRAYILPEYIVIEEGVTSVSADAFNGWYARGVVLPSTLRTIGDRAFAGCSILHVALPEGVTSVGSGAFAGSSPIEVTIPRTCAFIGDSAFTFDWRLMRLRVYNKALDISAWTVPTFTGEFVFDTNCYSDDYGYDQFRWFLDDIRYARDAAFCAGIKDLTGDALLRHLPAYCALLRRNGFTRVDPAEMERALVNMAEQTANVPCQYRTGSFTDLVNADGTLTEVYREAVKARYGVDPGDPAQPGYTLTDTPVGNMPEGVHTLRWLTAVTLCGSAAWHTLETSAIPFTLLEHTFDFDHPVVMIPADCVHYGTQTIGCTVCGHGQSSGLPPTGNHTWGEWEIDETAGERTRACTVCGETQTEPYTPAAADEPTAPTGFAAFLSRIAAIFARLRALFAGLFGG